MAEHLHVRDVRETYKCGHTALRTHPLDKLRVFIYPIGQQFTIPACLLETNVEQEVALLNRRARDQLDERRHVKRDVVADLNAALQSIGRSQAPTDTQSRQAVGFGKRAESDGAFISQTGIGKLWCFIDQLSERAVPDQIGSHSFDGVN